MRYQFHCPDMGIMCSQLAAAERAVHCIAPVHVGWVQDGAADLDIGTRLGPWSAALVEGRVCWVEAKKGENKNTNYMCMCDQPL